VLTMSVSLAPALYDTDARRASFYTRLVERVEAIPASTARALPSPCPPPAGRERRSGSPAVPSYC
jgi:hypothetical protein